MDSKISNQYQIAVSDFRPPLFSHLEFRKPAEILNFGNSSCQLSGRIHLDVGTVAQNGTFLAIEECA